MKIYTLLSVVITSIILLISCEDNVNNNSGNNNETYMLEDTISIAYEEVINIETPDFQISVDSIIDGRCPSDVVCVWQGEATVFFSKITASQAESSFSLTIMGLCNENCGGMTTIGNHQVELLELNPYPEIANPTAIEDYWAKIIVTTL